MSLRNLGLAAAFIGSLTACDDGTKQVEISTTQRIVEVFNMNAVVNNKFKKGKWILTQTGYRLESPFIANGFMHSTKFTEGDCVTCEYTGKLFVVPPRPVSHSHAKKQVKWFQGAQQK